MFMFVNSKMSSAVYKKISRYFTAVSDPVATTHKFVNTFEYRRDEELNVNLLEIRLGDVDINCRLISW